MSTELAKREIQDFLATKDADVACLSGHWGVGKTYAWREFLTKAKSERKIALPRYAYVSLFGINSLDELKFALFENTVERSHVGDEPSLQTAQQNLAATGLEAGRKLTSFIQQLPIVKNYLGGLGPLWFLTVRNQIICFDDIERRGKGLNVRDVLGLVSFLKERRDCKICIGSAQK